MILEEGPWDVVESVVKEPIQVEGAFDVVDGADASKSGPFNKDDQALVDLAKEGKKKGGLDRDEAVTLVELGKESKDPRINGDKSRGPEVHKDRKFKDEHIHIGPVDHIPVKIEVSFMNFNYEFEEDPSSGDFNAEKYVTEGEKIKVSIEGNSEIWISANSKGWLKLAKLCIEMGMRELNNGYHFHL